MKSSKQIKDELERRRLLPFVVESAHKHFVEVQSIISKSRQKSIVRARHDAWFNIIRATNMSLLEMATLFGVDHATIARAIVRMKLTKE